MSFEYKIFSIINPENLPEFNYLKLYLDYIKVEEIYPQEKINQLYIDEKTHHEIIRNCNNYNMSFLTAFSKYLNWVLTIFSNKNSNSFKRDTMRFYILLESVIKLIIQNPKQFNETEEINLFINYISLNRDQINFFNFLYKNSICTNKIKFYENFAISYEKLHKFREANEIFLKAFNNPLIENFNELKEKYKNFDERMSNRIRREVSNSVLSNNKINKFIHAQIDKAIEYNLSLSASSKKKRNLSQINNNDPLCKINIKFEIRKNDLIIFDDCKNNNNIRESFNENGIYLDNNCRNKEIEITTQKVEIYLLICKYLLENDDLFIKSEEKHANDLLSQLKTKPQSFLGSERILNNYDENNKENYEFDNEEFDIKNISMLGLIGEKIIDEIKNNNITKELNNNNINNDIMNKSFDLNYNIKKVKINNEKDKNYNLNNSINNSLNNNFNNIFNNNNNINKNNNNFNSSLINNNNKIENPEEFFSSIINNNNLPKNNNNNTNNSFNDENNNFKNINVNNITSNDFEKLYDNFFLQNKIPIDKNNNNNIQTINKNLNNNNNNDNNNNNNQNNNINKQNKNNQNINNIQKELNNSKYNKINKLYKYQQKLLDKFNKENINSKNKQLLLNNPFLKNNMHKNSINIIIKKKETKRDSDGDIIMDSDDDEYPIENKFSQIKSNYKKVTSKKKNEINSNNINNFQINNKKLINEEKKKDNLILNFNFEEFLNFSPLKPKPKDFIQDFSNQNNLKSNNNEKNIEKINNKKQINSNESDLIKNKNKMNSDNLLNKNNNNNSNYINQNNDFLKINNINPYNNINQEKKITLDDVFNGKVSKEQYEVYKKKQEESMLKKIKFLEEKNNSKKLKNININDNNNNNINKFDIKENIEREINLQDITNNNLSNFFNEQNKKKSLSDFTEKTIDNTGNLSNGIFNDELDKLFDYH